MYASGDLFLSSSLLIGLISSEIFWYYFHCPKNVLCSILSFVFWIFPPLDTIVQLESADSKENEISKYLFQDSFWHIFWAMRKMHHSFWKKRPLASLVFNALSFRVPLKTYNNWEEFLIWYWLFSLEKYFLAINE